MMDKNLLEIDKEIFDDSDLFFEDINEWDKFCDRVDLTE